MADSYMMSVIHAPVLSPRYSTIFAARGIEVCTQPAALHNTSTWRRLWGVAGGLSGHAALLPAISDGLANCFCGHPVLNPPLNPSGGQGFAGCVCCAERRLQNNPTPPHTAKLNFFLIVGTRLLENRLEFYYREHALG